ncbi:MAG: 23S rRNA (uracil(1939)-C(5))-methyltransferase RlmD [Terriglobia bacterium]
MTFEFNAQKLVYGGEALGHHDGRPVFVPLVLAGERAEVEIVRAAKGVLHARPLRIIEASPERAEPPCPYFGRCGGCQYQHLRTELQPEIKREILRETLRRIGKVAWDSEIILHTASPWNYRNQAQLKVARRADGQAALGFFESESHRVFPVDACRILSPRLNAILAALRSAEWARRLGSFREIDLLTDDRDDRVAVTLRGNIGHDAGTAIARDLLGKLPEVVSAAIAAEAGRQVLGEPGLAYRVGEYSYRVSHGSFFQVSRFLLPQLTAAVTEAPPGELALDLFAGVGLFTLPLSRHFATVIGVESAPESALDLEVNVRAHSLANVRVKGATVFDFLRRFAHAEPDLVVLDPPRAGVDKGALKLLADFRPKRIHYLSCSPPTLARDLGVLLPRGYQIISIEMFDLFPQTYHIESLVKLARSDLAGA